MLGTCDRLLDKTEAWCAETGCNHGDIVASRLHEDMLPFAYHMKSVGEHSAGAIAGVRMDFVGSLRLKDGQSARRPHRSRSLARPWGERG